MRQRKSLKLYPLTMCYLQERTQKCTKLFFNHYYKYFKIGKFAAFADGGFSYANEHICGDSESVNTWGIGIAPGVSYDLNNKISIDARLGGIGWEFSKYGNVKTNTFGFDLDNELKLGIYFKF